jgi:hypothetical protein
VHTMKKNSSLFRGSTKQECRPHPCLCPRNVQKYKQNISQVINSKMSLKALKSAIHLTNKLSIGLYENWIIRIMDCFY